MRSLRFVPIVFLVGAHGFALFVPYVAVVGLAALVVGRWKRVGAVP